MFQETLLRRVYLPPASGDSGLAVAAPLYRLLISAFDRLTGVLAVLNTSFNRNEPIVNPPTEAVDCLLRTHMDGLVMDSWLAVKAKSPDLETSATRPLVRP